MEPHRIKPLLPPLPTLWGPWEVFTDEGPANVAGNHRFGISSRSRQQTEHCSLINQNKSHNAQMLKSMAQFLKAPGRLSFRSLCSYSSHSSDKLCNLASRAQKNRTAQRGKAVRRSWTGLPAVRPAREEARMFPKANTGH